MGWQWAGLTWSGSSAILASGCFCSCGNLGIAWGWTIQDGFTLVSQVGWLGLSIHKSFILVFFTWWWKLSKRIRTEAVMPLESSLEVSCTSTTFLLDKASHRATPDSKGGEINFTSWCEKLQRIWGHFTSITKGNASLNWRFELDYRKGKFCILYSWAHGLNIHLLHMFGAQYMNPKGAMLNKVFMLLWRVFQKDWELPERMSA